MVALQDGTVIATKYRLERALARGGMGAVWLAKHQQLDRDVAIKFMAPELAASADARGRFEREAKSSASIKSPNIVQVFDYGIEDDTPYLVMELLDGEDLEERLEREQKLSAPAAAVILHQACRALRRAHEAKLVHRDLKPGNVFLAKESDEEVVKILDFGIAKASVEGMTAGKGTKTGSLIGSPHYMSPEQVRSSKQVDHRTDLWALGVIAYRSLTGRLPFPGEEIGEVLVDICTADIPVPSTLAPDLGPELDKFFAKALARDPAQRFQSAKELADAFDVACGVKGEGAPTSRLASTPTPPEGLPIDGAPSGQARASAADTRISTDPTLLADPPPGGAPAIAPALRDGSQTLASNLDAPPATAAAIERAGTPKAEAPLVVVAGKPAPKWAVALGVGLVLILVWYALIGRHRGRSEPPRTEPPRNEVPRNEVPRNEPPRNEPPRNEHEPPAHGQPRH